jgi:hypothetical protein
MFDSCCHESEEGHENGTPNQLDCPSSLRSDFEEQMNIRYMSLKNQIRGLRFNEMMKVIKFMNNIEKERGES